jgi:predicted type IV restriction endonuclease
LLKAIETVITPENKHSPEFVRVAYSADYLVIHDRKVQAFEDDR